jgi:hypothetical protein
MVAKVRAYQFLAEHLLAEGIRPLLVSVEDLYSPFYSLTRQRQ